MPETAIEDYRPGFGGPGAATTAESRLRALVETLERRLRKGDEQRRAMLHIVGDLNESNKRLANQRKAMLHILADYEEDRRRLSRQTERLDNSRRALLHILQDSHKDKLRLEASRKAMIHIMGDLRETTAEMQRREQELHDKQEQLVQAGKLATLGELTTGVAHELNNPLNNTGLFVGNAIDLLELGVGNKDQIVGELRRAMQQVRKATEIISHLRTFGRVASVSHEAVSLRQVIEGALSLMQEQLRLREIGVTVDLDPEEPVVVGNPIKLEQVFINLLTNARDAVAGSPARRFGSRARSPPPRWKSRSPMPGPGFRRGSSGGSSIRSSPPRRSGKARAWACPSLTGSSKSTAARSRSRVGPARAPRSCSTCPWPPPIRRRPPRHDDVARPHRRRRPGPAGGASRSPPAPNGRRDGRHRRLGGGRPRSDRRAGVRRDRHRHQDAGDGRSGSLGRDPDAAARHARPDGHRARRARAGASGSPRRGLRLHPEADRPGSRRGGVVPRDPSARTESARERPAGWPRKP